MSFAQFFVLLHEFIIIEHTMTTISVLAAFVAVAIVGWAVAELKGRACNYHQNEEEADALAKYQHADGYEEMNIRDVIRIISTKGFKTT